MLLNATAAFQMHLAMLIKPRAAATSNEVGTIQHIYLSMFLFFSKREDLSSTRGVIGVDKDY